jgi:hypothetical protein
MELHLYASVSEGVVERVRTTLETAANLRAIQVHRSISGLSQSLQPPKEDIGVVVLVVGEQEDIRELIAVRHLFRNVPIVLVVSETDAQTISLAHRLCPRYLTYVDGSLQTLKAVIDKMCKGYCHA